MSEIYIKVMKALQRNERKAQRYSSQYEGKEEQHTFHGGWNLGYWEGRVSALEEILDMLEDAGVKPEIDYTRLFLGKCMEKSVPVKIPEWDASLTYQAGDKVMYNGAEITMGDTTGTIINEEI